MKPRAKPAPVGRIRRQHRSRTLPAEEPVLRVTLEYAPADDPVRLARLVALLDELLRIHAPRR